MEIKPVIEITDGEIYEITEYARSAQHLERTAKSADEIATFHKNMHAEILRSVGVLVSQAFELGRKYERDGTR